MLLCGIDDAGRGPVIGPLVMAGIVIGQEDEDKLVKIKVKDSKLLTPKQRSFLYGKIIKIVKAYKIVIIPPEEVDKAVQKDDGLNLNWLEANKSIDIIHELKPDIAILDSPSNNLKSYSCFSSLYTGKSDKGQRNRKTAEKNQRAYRLWLSFGSCNAGILKKQL